MWPAYIKAHQHLFEEGDVTSGKLTGNVDGLLLFETTAPMKDMVNTVMGKVLAVSAKN